MIAALCVPPTRDAVQLYFRLHPNANINAEAVTGFLRVLSEQLAGPAVLVWDRLQAHRARITQEFFMCHLQLHPHFLPPYAPELNPDEGVWTILKRSLANTRPDSQDDLLSLLSRELRDLAGSQRRLRGCISHSGLPPFLP